MLPVLSSPKPAFVLLEVLLLIREARPYLEIKSAGRFEDDELFAALVAPAAVARGVLVPLPPLALALRLPAPRCACA